MLQRILYAPFYAKLDNGDYTWRPFHVGKGYRFKDSEAEPVIFYTRILVVLFFGLVFYTQLSNTALVPEGMVFDSAQELMSYKRENFFYIFIFFAVINLIIYFRLFALARSRGADADLSTSLLDESKGFFHFYIQLVKLMFKAGFMIYAIMLVYSIGKGLVMYFLGDEKGLFLSGISLVILFFMYLGWRFIKAGRS